MVWGKSSLLYEWPAVIEEEESQVFLERITGMAERLDLIEPDPIALPLHFIERREFRLQEEGTENV